MITVKVVDQLEYDPMLSQAQFTYTFQVPPFELPALYMKYNNKTGSFLLTSPQGLCETIVHVGVVVYSLLAKLPPPPPKP